MRKRKVLKSILHCICKIFISPGNGSAISNVRFRALKCSGSDCPVTDLSSLLGENWTGFNSACYKKGNEEKEHCFTTEGIYDKDVVRSAKLVQAKSGENSAEGFTFTKTSGIGRTGG